MKLNLGCSDDLRAGYVNVDCYIPDPAVRSFVPEFLAWNLGEAWPWETSSVDEIVAHHVFEHIDNPAYRANRGKIWCMNEAHRVLKPGGILDLCVPTVAGIGAFCDPTHVSFWTDDDRFYFCEEWNNPQGERGRLGPAYGITALFRIHYWRHWEYSPGRFHVMAKLEAVK